MMSSTPNLTSGVDLQPGPAVSAGTFINEWRARGDHPSIVADGCVISYSQLAERVEQRAEQLGDNRRLVMLLGENSDELIVTFFAALLGRHPVWLVPQANGAQTQALVQRYDPDLIVTAGRCGATLEQRRPGTSHELHHDLALLLSTSGSTGSSKVVRLSARNIEANAASIAQFLAITPADRAITSLPMHYCYGLSVVTSYLLSGASLITTTTSVVDPSFWHLAGNHHATSFAGVPQTFDLLDQVGFAQMELPSLRYITQAGGRLAPDVVRRYARLGAERGWDLYVMYGQTEATARMAYLPPHLAQEHPGAVGVPVPGGTITLQPHRDAGPGVGEIVYHGPNVMLGYAHAPTDLALGRTVDELATGDLARLNGAGLFEIVGRTSGFLKIFGLRVDLHQVQTMLDGRGINAVCSGEDGRLVIALLASDVPPGATQPYGDRVRSLVADELSLPQRCVEVDVYDELPLLASGKPDHRAITARRHIRPGSPSRSPRLGRRRESVTAVFADVLGDTDIDPSASFASLGGDSFTYIELSIRLEESLGQLPQDWHTTPIAVLDALESRRTRMTRVETNVVLRAAAIVMVVGTHMRAYRAPGGAHVLLAIAGFNFARFQLSASTAGQMLRRSLATVARVVVPTTVWIGVQMLAVGGYSLGALLLVNNYLGSPWRRGGRWQYWYFEAFAQIFLVCTLIAVVPVVRRWERQQPYLLPLGLLGASLLLRFEVITFGDSYNYLFRPHTIIWFFLIGWTAHRARTLWQRAVLTVVVALAVPGFFGMGQRELTVVVGLLALTWLPFVILPRPLNRVFGTVAAASMYIFLTHWQIWPPVDRILVREAALVVTLAAGVVVWFIVEKASHAGASWYRSRQVQKTT